MDEKLEQFNSNTLRVLDNIASVKVNTVSGKQKARWKNVIMVANQKRNYKKAEQKQSSD